MDAIQDEDLYLGPKRMAVWPEGQAVKGRGDNVVAMTQFEDIDAYHPALITRLLEMYEDPSVKKAKSFFAAGTKIHHLQTWGIPEAELVEARAKAFFKRAFKQSEAVVHIGWVNISRRGEYSMPHTHPDSTASVVYCLDPGDPNPDDPMDGLLAFVDPRYEACCRDDKAFMNTPFMPKMTAGSMIIFPSTLVHCVNPYAGERPRITFSWDINTTTRGQPRLPEEIF